MLTIDDLPDDVFLKIFNLYTKIGYRDPAFNETNDYESWQLLVHVCRRWRCLVFGSPRLLNLQLRWKPRTSTRKSLDVWPALPLVIRGMVTEELVDNLNAFSGLEHRISQIELGCVLSSQTANEKFWTAMQVPFPELEILCLSSRGSSNGPVDPVLPDTLLGGSAPRLRFLRLISIPFPGLPKLLLSATHLVNICLHDIPYSGYISPEAMATCLSTLTSLERLYVVFGSPHYRSPDLKSQSSFPPTRSVIPTLKSFRFKGVIKYLEEFVARVDAPQLYQVLTTFFYDIDGGFKVPELGQFINRTPILDANDEAHIIFEGDKALLRLRQSHPEPSDHIVEVHFLCGLPHWQFSSLQIFTSSLCLFLTIENLYIDGNLRSASEWNYGSIWNTEWLDLLLPFTAVKNLYVSEPLSPRIALVLQELTGARITEVLPALQQVLLEGFQPSEPVQEGIAQFISARQLTNHPVAISAWHRVGG